MSYYIKFRQKAISYLDAGNSYRKTAATFKVSVSAIQEWKSLPNETGELTPKWRKIDPDKLRKFVKENPDAYQHEIATAFGVRLYAVPKALKRLNITRKKTTIYKESDEKSR